MKKLSVILMAFLFLAACSEEPTAEPEEIETVEETPAEDEPTQEELNAQMKETATEIDFVEANGGGLEVGARVKATGEVSALDPSGMMGGDFMLSVEEGDGFGVYNISNLNTVEIPLEEGQLVTVYGSFNGPEEGTSMPSITATIIE